MLEIQLHGGVLVQQNKDLHLDSSIGNGIEHHSKLGVVPNTCNSSVWETSEASLGYRKRPYHKQIKRSCSEHSARGCWGKETCGRVWVEGEHGRDAHPIISSGGALPVLSEAY